jgi:transcriptional regulator with XRE-family HTH domain
MIKEYRLTRKLTQQQLADMVGYSQSTISKHEREDNPECATCYIIRHEIYRMIENERRLEAYRKAQELPVGRILVETSHKSFLRRLAHAIKHFIWR